MPPRAPRRTSVVGTTTLLLLSPLLLVASVPGARSADLGRGLRVSLATPPPGGSGAPVFAPGLALPLDLQVANPYGAVVEVTELRVRVGAVEPAAVPGCTAADFVASDAPVTTLLVPARGSTTLSSAGVPVARWPRVSMPAAAPGRAACRGLEVSLDFVATGRFR